MAVRLVSAKYQLTRLVGRGGMGEVHEATHITTGRRVAVKLLTQQALREASSSDDSDLVARLRREARATGQVDSQHIVQVLDAGEDTETHEPFMVMEFLEGEDLNHLVRRLGPLPVDLALRATAQACLGLEKAHAAGIIHRDVKPANLFLSQGDGGQRTLKILDFGIARLQRSRAQDGEATGDLTRTGTMLGSPHYMAPEQVRGLKTIDARADVWSLGVSLYKLLTGRTPHVQGEGGVGDLLITICCVPAPLVQEVAPWVPPDVAEVVHHALQIEPEHRYPSAHAMLEALLPLLPSGFEIDDTMLVPVPDAERANVAPRAALADSSSRRITEKGPGRTGLAEEGTETRTALSATDGDHLLVRPKNRAKAALGLLGAAVALLAGWLGVSRLGGHASPVPSATASAVAVVSPPASADTRKVALFVSPGATVEVDDVAVTRDSDDRILLVGPLGGTHRVHASKGTREVTTIVAITESGAVPAAVIVPSASASTEAHAQAAAPAVRPTATPRTSSQPPASKATAPANGSLVTTFE